MRVEGIVAPNPGIMTGPGTNTWLVESGGEAIVVDPGPAISEHLSRVHRALDGTRPVAILVTHTHPDHAPGANRLARELDAPCVARADGPGFVADRIVIDGDEIRLGDERALVVATPGHTEDSTSYRIGDALFSGDHIIGGSTVVVEDMTTYMASLRRLLGTGLTRIYPGHGPVIADPDAVIGDYLAHRQAREAAILEAVGTGASTVGDVVAAVYGDVDPALHPVAAVSVAAHLRKLHEEGTVRFDGSGVRPVEASP